MSKQERPNGCRGNWRLDAARCRRRELAGDGDASATRHRPAFDEALEPLESRILLAAVLVKDLNPTVGSSSPSNFMDVGNGLTVFSADDGIHGNELWRTDGTAGGTSFVYDLAAGSSSSTIKMLASSGGAVYMQVGWSLWKTDGSSANTVQLKSTAIRNGSPSEAVILNGALYFTGYDSTEGDELWRSDGTSGGTARFMAFTTGNSTLPPRGLTVLNGWLYFAAPESSTSSTYALWKSDGTTANATLVKTFTPAAGTEAITHLQALNGALWFAGSDSASGVELWKSDGTASGTAIFKDIAAGSGSGIDRATFAMGAAGANVFFSAIGAGGASDLWVTDGNAATAAPIHTFDGPINGASPAAMVTLGSRIVFAAQAADGTCDVWSSDGTGAGTILLADNSYVGTVEGPPSIVTYSGSAYFRFATASGSALWKTDGSVAGTSQVTTFGAPGLTAAQLSLASTSSGIYFGSRDAVTGLELWRSDGTASGTALLRDIKTMTEAAGIDYHTAVIGTSIYFFGSDGQVGTALWRLNTLDDSITMVKDFTSIIGGRMVVGVRAVGETLLFGFGFLTGGGMDVWRSDGTDQGTFLIRQFSSPSILPVTVLNGIGYFPAAEAVNGGELWRSDGTVAGTYLVKDINPGSTGSNVQQCRVLNGALIFLANDGVHGSELWRSDGTADGTYLITDLVPGVGSLSYFTPPQVAGGKLWIATQTKVYVSDGTAAGSMNLVTLFGAQNFSEVGNWVLFTGDDSVHGYELWRSDGTVAGTSMVVDLVPGSGKSGFYSNYVLVNGSLLLTNVDAEHGRELWKSDGTAAGTILVKDINPGAGDGPANVSIALDGVAYFAADDGVHGREVWRSDGTPEGTFLCQDIFPGPESGGGVGLGATTVGNNVYIINNDGVHGAEWWKIDATAPTVAAGSAKALPNGLHLSMSERVSAGAAPLRITNRDSGEIVDPARIAWSYDSPTWSFNFTFPGFAGGALPDGNYTATLLAGSVSDPAGNALAADYAIDFFALRGDANGDRTVNFADLVKVSQNYKKTGMSWSDGDFNGDGKVDFADLVAVSQQYKKSVAPPVQGNLLSQLETPATQVAVGSGDAPAGDLGAQGETAGAQTGVAAGMLAGAGSDAQQHAAAVPAAPASVEQRPSVAAITATPLAMERQQAVTAITVAPVSVEQPTAAPAVVSPAKFAAPAPRVKPPSPQPVPAAIKPAASTARVAPIARAGSSVFHAPAGKAVSSNSGGRAAGHRGAVAPAGIKSARAVPMPGAARPAQSLFSSMAVHRRSDEVLA